MHQYKPHEMHFILFACLAGPTTFGFEIVEVQFCSGVARNIFCNGVESCGSI